MVKPEITVGIITIDDYVNYGNRLQNYALTKLMQNEGFSVINTIRVYTKEEWVKKTLNPLKRLIKRMVPFSSVKNMLVPGCVEKTGGLKEREYRFKDFVYSYTQIIDPIVCNTNKEARELLSKYGIDYYVVGSDQVWNPFYAGESYQFLTFAPPSKRLSFAASIGAEKIPEKLKWYYKKCFKSMHYISVREEAAAELIYSLCGQNVDVTLDPTLLLPYSEWDKIVKKPQLELETSYICTYFLGEIPEAVNNFADVKGLKVYRLNSMEDERLFSLDPAEFLYMIKNASYVLTDSFHAVAFSIKFHKEFYVFERKQFGVNNMFSRIISITNKFGLGNRIQNREIIVEQKQISNWYQIEDILEKERDSSISQLKKAMGL